VGFHLSSRDKNIDKRVNAKDSIQLGTAFGSIPSSMNWNPNADIDDDKNINAKDAIILGRYFNQFIWA